MYESIQFRGKKKVMEAFTNCKVDAWAIYNKKDLITKGIGEDMLNEFLELISDSGTKAIYKLKVYEDVTDPKTIKEKTEADGSFSFTLCEDFEGEGGRYENTNRSNRLFERLGAIERKLEEREPEDETIGSVLIGMIKEPGGLETLVNVGKSLLGLPTSQPSHTYQPPQRMGATETAEQRYIRLSAAITILEKHDNRIVEHLEKLAKIADSNTSQFKLLLSTLDTMQ